jgi:hypothetical protein
MSKICRYYLFTGKLQWRQEKPHPFIKLSIWNYMYVSQTKNTLCSSVLCCCSKNFCVCSNAIRDTEETYLCVKHGGGFIDTACSRDSRPWASQNGRSTLAPFSIWIYKKRSDPLLYKKSILLALLVGSTMQSIQFPVGAHDKYCRRPLKIKKVG